MIPVENTRQTHEGVSEGKHDGDGILEIDESHQVFLSVGANGKTLLFET